MSNPASILFSSLLALMCVASAAVTGQEGYLVDFSDVQEGDSASLSVPGFCLNFHRDVPDRSSPLSVSKEQVTGDVKKIVDLQFQVRGDRSRMGKILQHNPALAESMRIGRLLYEMGYRKEVTPAGHPDLTSKLKSHLSTFTRMTDQKQFDWSCQNAIWSVTDSKNFQAEKEQTEESIKKLGEDADKSDVILRRYLLSLNAKSVDAILCASGAEGSYFSDITKEESGDKVGFVPTYKEAKKSYSDKNFTKALTLFNRCLDYESAGSNERSEIRVWLYRCMRMIPNAKEYAHVELRKSIEEAPGNREANYLLAIHLHQTGKLTEALPYFEKSVEQDADAYPLANFLLGRHRFEQSEFDQALPYFRKFLRSKHPSKFPKETMLTQFWIQVAEECTE